MPKLTLQNQQEALECEMECRWLRGESLDEKRAWSDIEQLKKIAHRLRYERWTVQEAKGLERVWHIVCEVWSEYEKRGESDVTEIVDLATRFFERRKRIDGYVGDLGVDLFEMIKYCVEFRAFSGVDEIVPGELRDWIEIRERDLSDEEASSYSPITKRIPAWHHVKSDEGFVFVRTQNGERVSWWDCCFEADWRKLSQERSA